MGHGSLRFSSTLRALTNNGVSVHGLITPKIALMAMFGAFVNGVVRQEGVVKWLNDTVNVLQVGTKLVGSSSDRLFHCADVSAWLLARGRP